MSIDPIAALRAAAPAVASPTPQARSSAYRAAVAQRPVDVPSSSLRRWWVAGISAVSAAALAVAGTAVPAVGQPSVVPELVVVTAPPPSVRPEVLYLTHPDGAVYTVTAPDPLIPLEDS
jgi:hypothetical protein